MRLTQQPPFSAYTAWSGCDADVWRKVQAEKGATPGVGTALDFLAWMRVKTMNTESLAFCIQQGGVFCQYLSDLQAAVGDFQVSHREHTPQQLQSS